MKKLISKTVSSALLASTAMCVPGSAGWVDDLIINGAHKGDSPEFMAQKFSEAIGKSLKKEIVSRLPFFYLVGAGMVLTNEITRTLWRTITGESDFFPNLMRRFAALKEYIEDFIDGRKRLNTENFEEFFDKFEEYLNLKIIGQPKAIKKVIDSLKSHYANTFISNATPQDDGKYESGCCLIFDGPPGTGKTTLINEISRVIKLPVVDLSRPEIISHSAKLKENKDDIVSILLTPAKDAYGRDVYTKFYRSLQQPGDCLVIVNELDKLRILDFSYRGLKGSDRLDTSGKWLTSSIDEAFRDFIDTGKILNFVKKGSIMVASGNNTQADMLKMDPSWVSRMGNFIIEFDYLRKDSDCEKCMKVKLQSNYENFLKKQGTEILFDDASLKNFISQIPVEKRTGRHFTDMINSLGGKIYSFNLRHKGAKSIIIKWSENEGFYIPEPKKGN